MTTPWNVLSAAVTRLSDRIDLLPTFREATVVATSPLTVLFDTDTSPIVIVRSLVASTAIGSRVLTLRIRHYLWVIGVKGGGGVNNSFRGTTAQRIELALSGAAVDGMKFYDTDENREYIWRGSAWAWNISPGTLLGQYTQPNGNVDAGGVFLRLALADLPEGLNVYVTTSAISLYNPSAGIATSALRRNLSANDVTSASSVLETVRSPSIPSASSVVGTPRLHGVVTIGANGAVRFGVTSSVQFYGADNPSIYAFAA